MDFADRVCLSQRMSQVCLQTPAACRLDHPDNTQISADHELDNARGLDGDDAAEFLCSQDFFCTPDFITPVENQFHVGFGDNSKDITAAMLQSPVGLTPLRAKRPRGERMASNSIWSDEDILSSQPEPPQLQLPEHIFPAPQQLPFNQDLKPLAPLLEMPQSPQVGTSQEKKGQPQLADSQRPALAPKNTNTFGPPLASPAAEATKGALPPPWKSSQANPPSGKPTAGRDRIAFMRRRVQSPPCMRNPFLLEIEAEKPKVSQGMAMRPVFGGMVAGSGYSHYREEFQEIEEIGKGHFSRVFKVRKRIDGCLYAVKRSIREFRHESERRQALLEVQALAALGPQENVLRYYTAWCESDHLYIQTELCEGSLAKLQKSGHTFSEKDLIDFLQQMAKALVFIHARGIVHLDLKPDNIYTMKGSYRLGDFGRATKLDGSMPVEEGDARYMPMEILNNDYSDLAKVDMFSLGASAYELARNAPLPGSGTPFQSIREGKLMLLPGYTNTLQHLIKALLHPDPKCRPSAELLLNHTLITKS